jgi:hypothetical protein
MIILILCVIALFVFAYHYERNGNPANWGDFVCRLIWAGAFGVGYISLALAATKWFILLWMIVSAFAEILIPHAFAQRMGNRADSWTMLPVSKWWPVYWMKPFLPYLSNTLQDFIGMGFVGLLRGSIVFGLPVCLGWFWFGAALAIGITALWQPLSYLVGRFTPWSLWGNAPDSSQWGEFFVPIGWAFALAVALWP